MPRDIDTNGAHGFNGQLTDVAARVASGAVYLVGAAAELAEQAFGHLAAHAIAGAENENAVGHGSFLLCAAGQEWNKKGAGFL